MPTKRYSKLAPETKRRILDAARAEFIAHGYDNASLNQIIQAAGINKGSLYYYFEDKADLFLTVVMDAQDEMVRSMTGRDFKHIDEFFAQRPPDFWDFMLKTTMIKVSFVKSHPAIMRLFADLYRQVQRLDAPEPFKASYAESQKAILGFIHMGQAQGAIRTDLSDQMLAELGMALSEVMNRQLLTEPDMIDRFDLEELRAYAAIQVDMLKRMLQAVPEGGTSR